MNVFRESVLAPASGMGRNRWSGTASTGRSIGMRTAATEPAVTAVPIGTDLIAGAPTTVDTAERFVIADANIHVTAISRSASGNHASRKGSCGQTAHGKGCRQTPWTSIHLLASLLSLSGHSIKPKVAPLASDTTATLPP